MQSLLCIPELLQLIEVLVQDVHLRRPHPCHPNYRGTSLAVFSPPGPYQPLLGLASQIWGFPEPKISFSPWAVVSHPGDCKAGRPALDWLLTDGCTSPRQETQLWCAPLQCTAPHHLHHLAPRDPSAGRGWREPLNPTCPGDDGKAGPTQKPVRTQLIGRRASREGVMSPDYQQTGLSNQP